MDNDRVGVGWARRRVKGHDGKHAVSAGGGVGCDMGRGSSEDGHVRREQKLLLTAHVAAGHQVDVLAPLHQVMLAFRVQVDHPVNGSLSCIVLAVPEGGRDTGTASEGVGKDEKGEEPTRIHKP